MASSATVVEVGSSPPDSEILMDEEIKYVCFHDFKNLPVARGEVVVSPEFLCAGHKWTLHLYPGGSDEARDRYYSVFLKSEQDSIIVGNYEIPVVKVSGLSSDFFGRDKRFLPCKLIQVIPSENTFFSFISIQYNTLACGIL
jgi:hypothetical protein